MFLKRHVRASKMEPLVDEVELLGANTNYAHICYPDGRTITVSTKHLAPRGELDSSLPQTSLRPDCSPRVGLNDPPVLVPLLTELNAQPVPEPVSTEPEQTPAPQNMPGQGVPPQCSSRIIRPPDHLLFKPRLSPPGLPSSPYIRRSSSVSRPPDHR